MTALTWSETPEGRWPQILELARMSESMVERVAKAIFLADPNGSAGLDYDALSPAAKNSMVFAARAAIEAMSTPTKEMLDAAWRVTQGATSEQRMFAILGEQRKVHDAKMCTRYNAMISACCAESPTRMEMKR